MNLTHPDTIRNLLSENGTKPLKFYGQNFLKDSETLKSIVNTAEITKDDIVIEVGPGLGTVTKELAQRANKVFSFEIDETKLPILKRTLSDFDNVTIQNIDFLKLNFAEFLSKNDIEEYVFVSSLPYNVAKKIIRLLLQADIKPKRMSMLIQKEVGKKYAPSKNENESFLSNYIKLYGEVAIVKHVPPTSFIPEPKVHSVVMSFELNEKQFDPAVIKFIKVGFANPRKKLLKNLSNNYKMHKELLENIFKELEINENTRPGQIKVDDWLNIYKRLKDAAKN